MGKRMTNRKDFDAEDAWDDSDEVVQLDVNEPLDKVIPVRLSSEKWEALRREARELGVGPSTLVACGSWRSCAGSEPRGDPPEALPRRP